MDHSMGHLHNRYGEEGDDAVKCLRCGEELAPGKVYCRKCGYTNPDRKSSAAGKKADPESAYRYVPDKKYSKEKIPMGKQEQTEDTTFHITPEKRFAQDTVPKGGSSKQEKTEDTTFHFTPEKKFAQETVTKGGEQETTGEKDTKIKENPPRPADDTAGKKPPVQPPSHTKPVQKREKSIIGKILCAAAIATVVYFLRGGILPFADSLFSRPGTSKSTEPMETVAAVTEVATLPSVNENAIEPDYTFYSIAEMKNTLAPTCIDEDMEVIVRYMGNDGEVQQYAHCFLFGGRSGSVTELEPGVFRIIAKPYSGSRMLKAYRTKNYAGLTEDEIRALSVAESVVNAARKAANSDMELELWLHDWMCENISYYGVDFTIEFTDRRQLNAVGALLDGKANCQGYTDCFYLLGNMAGFVVDRQVMPNHIFNTIKLGGSWYIVDVTYDDIDEEYYGRKQYMYQFFNVGMDYCDDRTWNYQETRQNINEVSGQYFYYNLEGEYPRTYYSLEDLAERAIQEYKSGRKMIHMMIHGQRVTHEHLFPYLEKVAARQGVRYNVRAVYSWGLKNTCFMLNFE